MPMRVATFNVQNLRLRRAGGEAQPRLDGAWDKDDAEDRSPAARALDAADRRLTARVLRATAADVIALQEVFDAATLDHFHDRVLVPLGTAPFPYRICKPGNDGRGLDVALMSRRPFARVASHARLTAADLAAQGFPQDGPDGPVFRRDCLEAEVGRLALFVCHLKAPWPDPRAAWTQRRREALAVRCLVARRFPDPARGLWLILGDLNEPRAGDDGGLAIAPLLGRFSVNLAARMPVAERWSWAGPGGARRSMPDLMLASPALAAACPEAVPETIRAGMGREAAGGARFAETGRHRPHASDHAAVAVTLPGL
jgi:endonuclease/exonuclease/phosphatase family metal-dependent hydrolase